MSRPIALLLSIWLGWGALQLLLGALRRRPLFPILCLLPLAPFEIGELALRLVSALLYALAGASVWLAGCCKAVYDAVVRPPEAP